MALPEITIYSKPDCCLCDRAKEKLKRLQKLHEFVMREVNILEDPFAHAMFKDEIPVIFVNGKKAFKYRLDEKQFVRILQSTSRKRNAEGVSAP
jgi:glutaredoxin